MFQSIAAEKFIRVKKIILDCERMRHRYTGLYSFCKQLSHGLLKLKQPDEQLNFYVPEKEIGFAGKASGYLKQQWWHKICLPDTNKYDVWHCAYQTSNYYPPRSKAKVVLTIHDLNFLHENKPLHKQKKYLNNVQQKVKRTDSIVANSNFVRKEIEENLNLYNKPVTTIYSGSITLLDIADKKPSFITDDKPFFFSVGTIARKKNFHVLPALLLENDYKLIIAGITQNKEYKTQIINEAKKLGVNNRLILPGPVSEDEKYWLIKNCKVFCFPSIAEGYGLPVIEAMHFGMPCLLSTYTSLPEIGGPHAFYMQSFDPKYMGSLATEVLQQIALQDKTNDIIQWSSQFSWQKTAEQYMDVYRRIY
jgi:glycosyltransferase involved in cell wall biosynthesis